MGEFGHGRVLFVDLSSGSINEESLSRETCRDFIGGQGLGARILYERIEPGADPLGPDNILGFIVGPLTGTGIHGARFQVVGKSPLTGGWGDANCGGSLATELKMAGYDGVFFTGISAKPIYLFLHNDQAELKDASHLWGKDTIDTEEKLKDELRDKEIGIACIGPAGESQSLLAAIIHEGSAAARSGLGAVMGSKRLKALVTKGSKKVVVADPERFAILRKNYLHSVKTTDHPFTNLLKTWGTSGLTSSMIAAGDSTIKNWTLFGEEGFPNHNKISDDEVTKYQTKKHACKGCPIGCKGWFRVSKSPYGMIESAKPEYETLAMFGSNCMIDSLEAVAKANDLCNRYGLDTIGVGSAVAFAMECYERGVITRKDSEGIEITWGNADAMVAMVRKICRREGLGALLADGSKRSAEQIGQGSEKWAIHIGGQDLPAHDGRAASGYGWGFVCDPTPGRHTLSFAMITWEAGFPCVPYPELQFPKSDIFDARVNAPIYAAFSDLEHLWTSAGLCVFGFWPPTLPLVEAISAVTGYDFSLSQGLAAGRRIQTLRQAFNIREGVKTNEWRLPDRLAAIPSTGPTEGTKVDYQTMKENGYAALGWEAATGKPLDSTLKQLGIKELVGKLP